MELPGELLKQFASITNDRGTSPKETTAYGTVNISDGKCYVKLDGTDSLTPVSMTMDARDGDRVMVMIKNHAATIIGNATSPASARTASSYMKLVEDGLIVGKLDDDGGAIGTYSLIGAGTYYIVDENGNIVASFSGSTIKLGSDDSSEISLCNGNGNIKVENGTLVVYGKNAVGMRSMMGLYKSEMVCKVDTEDPVVAMQVYKEKGDSCSVMVRKNGISLSTPVGAYAAINGNEITHSGNLMVNGAVQGSGSVNKNGTVTVKKKVLLPNGYRLAGIRRITTNHSQLCHITQFNANPKTNEVSATFENIGESTLSLTVRIEWFALRTENAEYSPDEIVNW